MSLHWLRLSPSQCPEYRPWLGKVEREMTSGRFPRIWISALEGNGESWGQEVRAAHQEFALSPSSAGGGLAPPQPRIAGGLAQEIQRFSTRNGLIHPLLPEQRWLPSSLRYSHPAGCDQPEHFLFGSGTQILFQHSPEQQDFVLSHPQAGRKRDAWVPRCGFGFHQPIEVVEVVVHRGFLLGRGTHRLCREGIAQHGCQEGEARWRRVQGA